ncbi:MAG: CBS domain-containing protein [Sedimentisphaerales bacterium]|nr:CBS domain-containing protein [Sedimentisphaerales bacterium]
MIRGIIQKRNLASALARLGEGDASFSPIPRVVHDIMTSKVEVLTLDDSVKTCLKFMENHHVRHAPVLDYPDGKRQEPVFIGVVSQRDVLRIGAPNIHGSIPLKPDPKALRRLLARVVTRNPKIVVPDTPIIEAIDTMLAEHIDMLPVVRDGKVTGIVTTTDLLRLLLRLEESIEQVYRCQTKQRNLSNWLAADDPELRHLAHYAIQNVDEIMAIHPVTLLPEQNLNQAMEILQEHRLRHLPIVDEMGKLVGILTDRDILRNLPSSTKPKRKKTGGFREDLFDMDHMHFLNQVCIRDIMTSKPITVHPDYTVMEATRILLRKKIGAIPVVDDSRRLTGILSIVDLLRMVRAFYID